MHARILHRNGVIALLAIALILPVRPGSAQTEVRGAGLNIGGQLGDGSVVDAPTPTTVNGLSNVIAVAAGSLHTLALRADGTVWAWGNNRVRQLGIINEAPWVHDTPLQVPDVENAIAIAAGGFHSLALLANGTVKSWGWNSAGQLGRGSPSNVGSAPGTVNNLTNVTAIDAGFLHCLARKADGRVYAWGDNRSGQLGDEAGEPEGVPFPVEGITGATAVASGHLHSVALLADGTVRTWGRNVHGQLGDGTTTDHDSPVVVKGISNAVAIAAGGTHTMALLKDGTVRAWGKNDAGQLGDGTTIDALAPVPVLTLSGVSALAGGGNHSLARRDDGETFAWGSNLYGALADGSGEDQAQPVQIAGFAAATSLACGDFHSVVAVPDLCAADVDDSNAVDVDDLIAVILGWGCTSPPGEGGCPADVDGSGLVDVDDLVAVILAWGDCP